MANLISSRVVFRESQQPTVPTIQAVATDVTAFVGVAEWGPINTLTRVTSWAEYQEVFGGFVADGELAQNVYGFFITGGIRADVVRVVHVTDVTDPTTLTSVAATLDLETAVTAPTAAQVTGTLVEPFALTPGATLTVDVDGGGPAVATFDATAGFRTSGNTEPFVLADGQTWIVSVDGAPDQTATFNTAEFVSIGAATAQEIVNVLNAEITGIQATVSAGAVVVTSDTKGTASSIEETGGTASAALSFPVGPGTGTGDVADISAVTVAEIETVVEADIAGIDVIDVAGAVRLVSGTTGPTSTVQVSAGSVQVALGLATATYTGTSGAAVPTLTIDAKYDGARGNGLSVTVSAASNGDADRFDLAVLKDGIPVTNEIFVNLSMDAADPRHVEAIVNDAVSGSLLIQATDLDAAVPDPVPATGTFGPMTGGDDGLVGLVDADFVGGKTVGGGTTGLRVLDTSDAAMVTVPRATATIHNALVDYCQNIREGALFAFLDLPAVLSVQATRNYVQTTAALTGLSTYAAMYWPRILVENPDPAYFGAATLVEIPNSGSVAGRHSATDRATPGGVYEYSAGLDASTGVLAGVRGVADETVLDREARDLLVEVQVNPINSGTINGEEVVYLDGTLTLREDSDFERTAKRRGFILIGRSLVVGLDPYRHKGNTPSLRKEIAGLVNQFLRDQLQVGAFASNDPKSAYFVDVGDALNNAAVIAAKQIRVRVGIALKDPADFIIIEIGPLGAS